MFGSLPPSTSGKELLDGFCCLGIASFSCCVGNGKREGVKEKKVKKGWVQIKMASIV